MKTYKSKYKGSEIDAAIDNINKGSSQSLIKDSIIYPLYFYTQSNAILDLGTLPADIRYIKLGDLRSPAFSTTPITRTISSRTYNLLSFNNTFLPEVKYTQIYVSKNEDGYDNDSYYPLNVDARFFDSFVSCALMDKNISITTEDGKNKAYNLFSSPTSCEQVFLPDKHPADSIKILEPTKNTKLVFLSRHPLGVAWYYYGILDLVQAEVTNKAGQTLYLLSTDFSSTISSMNSNRLKLYPPEIPFSTIL